jgi:PAS domain-containing protein
MLYMAGTWYLGRGLGASIKTAVRLGVERSELVTRLRERGAQLEATIDGINQGVAVFEVDGGLLAWNQRHGELHDYPEALYRQGTPVGEFVRADLERVGPGWRGG